MDNRHEYIRRELIQEEIENSQKEGEKTSNGTWPLGVRILPEDEIDY